MFYLFSFLVGFDFPVKQFLVSGGLLLACFPFFTSFFSIVWTLHPRGWMVAAQLSAVSQEVLSWCLYRWKIGVQFHSCVDVIFRTPLVEHSVLSSRCVCHFTIILWLCMWLFLSYLISLVNFTGLIYPVPCCFSFVACIFWSQVFYYLHLWSFSRVLWIFFCGFI